MKVRTHKLPRAIVVGFAVATCATPSALADQPKRLDPWGSDAVYSHQVRTPAPLGEHGTGQNAKPAAPAALIGEHGTGQNGRVVQAHSASPVFATPAGSTFDWGDAAIGAGFAAALSLLSGGAVIAARRRSRLAH
jgi:hypothetical protein